MSTKHSIDTYQTLAGHLATSPLGAPYAPELLDILGELFTPEQAELAALLPFKPAPLSKLAGELGPGPGGTGRRAGRHGRRRPGL